MHYKNSIDRYIKYSKTARRKALDYYRTWLFKGDKVHCECCGWKGKRFFEGVCPNCQARTRTRLIPFSLAYFKLLDGTPNILHVAPNKNEMFGVTSKLSDTKIEYHTMDIRPEAKATLVQDLTQMTLQDNTYDLAIIWHVFEHIKEDIKAMAEVYRVLKPNGKLLMSVPIHPKNNKMTFESDEIPYEKYLEIHGHEDHCRSCGLDYFKRFEIIGFKTQELKVKDLPEDKIIKFGLSEGHIAWCFTK